MLEVEGGESIQTYDADSEPQGISYGQWTVRWWQWFFSIPISTNNAGSLNCMFGNQFYIDENVHFLWGKVGDNLDIYPSRYCRISASCSILFPVINCEANFLECPSLDTKEALIQHVKVDEDTIVQKSCQVDGRPTRVERVGSDPVMFHLKFHPDNAFRIKGTETLASADGYWVFLKPLSRGIHTLMFRGKCESGRLCSGADYLLDVI